MFKSAGETKDRNIALCQCIPGKIRFETGSQAKTSPLAGCGKADAGQSGIQLLDLARQRNGQRVT